MHVVVLASQKGGSGKTTLTSHLAVTAEAAGVGKVALIDTDPQAGLAMWWDARKAETPSLAAVKGTLAGTLKGLEKLGMALVVIDTPPALGNSIASAIAVASLVVIPVRPSPNDLRAVGGTVDLARGCDKPFLFVVNAARSGTRLTESMQLALTPHGLVAPVLVQDRLDFRTAMVDGRTACELSPKGQAATEITDLWTFIAGRLARG
jgi:chromosome partitioning protein